MERSDVDVILVRPARAANVGGACRALKNMGFRAPIVVGSPDLDRAEAARVAWGAEELVAAMPEAASLASAAAGAQFLVATSGRAAATWTPRELARYLAGRSGRAAIAFGPEADGLTAEEQRRADVVVRIPTAPAHSSLNLAQAVLVMAYELSLALGDTPDAARVAAEPADVRAAFSDLEAACAAIGYVDPDRPGPALTELLRLVARAEPTAREVTLLRGLARQMRWAGERARERR